MSYPVRRFAFALLLFAVGSAHAAPITFNFTFADPASSATAVGTITFESSLLANPGNNSFTLPDPAVLALDVTVSGSANGNGQFGLADFTGVVFETNGGTLNLSQSLLGQPTSGSPWGTTPSDGEAGDFNLFSGQAMGQNHASGSRYADQSGVNGVSGLPPDGVWYFTLGANGGNGEPMVLVAMGPAGSRSVPGLGLAGLLALFATLGAAAFWQLRRHS